MTDKDRQTLRNQAIVIASSESTKSIMLEDIYGRAKLKRNNALITSYGSLGNLAAAIVEDIDTVTTLKGVGLGGVLTVLEKSVQLMQDENLVSHEDPETEKTNHKGEEENLAENSLPVFSESARNWHSAFIGKTGSGKTYAARGEVEDLLDLGRQVVIIDPTGAWHGLRSNADGEPSGYQIAIFGGACGDRPLTPDMAPALGRIAGTTHQSMILDLSGISLELEDQREIVYEFLRNLYRTNRKPIHLVIDEADEFCPQELDKDTKLLRTLVARIMARGRSLGFRCTLITQRPAKIDKNSLSQIESMAVLRVTAPQDKKSLTDWFSDKGGPDQKEILNSIGIFQTGEGCVFTGIDGTYEKRKFRKVKTYDSSSTPVDAEGNEKTIDTGDIDLSSLDEKIVYPEENDEIELEKAVARRRNLEEENKRLRARVLKAEARFEAMRRVFVQIRAATESAFVDDGLEAVDYADMLLLRNEVAKDNLTDLDMMMIDLNDIEGIPEDIEGDWVPSAEEKGEIDGEGNEAMPTRTLTDNEKSIISEISIKPDTLEAIQERCNISMTHTEMALGRLMKEGSIKEEDGVFFALVSAHARQLSDNQISVLEDANRNPGEPLSGSSATIKSLRRGGFIDKFDLITPRGQESLAYLTEARP